MNRNGVKDSLEPGLSGWTTTISGPIGGSTTTDSLGRYRFASLPSGPYTVGEVLKAGWTQIYPPSPGTYVDSLAAGQNISNRNFGNSTVQEGCTGNVLKSWSFIDGAVPGAMPSPGQSSYWSSAYGNPDVAPVGGCGDSAYIGMWGNRVIGEALQQTLAAPFVKGATYTVSFCARWMPDPGRPYPVQFAFRASNSPLTGPQASGGVLIGVSQPIMKFP